MSNGHHYHFHYFFPASAGPLRCLRPSATSKPPIDAPSVRLLHTRRRVLPHPRHQCSTRQRTPYPLEGFLNPGTQVDQLQLADMTRRTIDTMRRTGPDHHGHRSAGVKAPRLDSTQLHIHIHSIHTADREKACLKNTMDNRTPASRAKMSRLGKCHQHHSPDSGSNRSRYRVSKKDQKKAQQKSQKITPDVSYVRNTFCQFSIYISDSITLDS